MDKIIGKWKYSLEDKIGRGSTAEVYKAFHQETNQIAAIKIVDIKKVKVSAKFFKYLNNEIEILKQLNHDNVVKLYDVIIDRQYKYLIFEYCSGGELTKYIPKNKGVSEVQARNWLVQLTKGLKYLRSKNIIHRDLKPQNILLSDNDPKKSTIKIADFGFAKIHNSDELLNSICGTPLYMAPEMLKDNKYSDKSDLWSIGCILYEMLTGKVLVNVSNLSDLIKRLENPPPVKIEVKVSKQCLHLLSALLQYNIKSRINWEEFFSHPFVCINDIENDFILVDSVDDKIKRFLSIIELANNYYKNNEIDNAITIYIKALKLMAILISDKSIINQSETIQFYFNSYYKHTECLLALTKNSHNNQTAEYLIYENACALLKQAALSEVLQNPEKSKVHYNIGINLLEQCYLDLTNESHKQHVKQLLDKAITRYHNLK